MSVAFLRDFGDLLHDSIVFSVPSGPSDRHGRQPYRDLRPVQGRWSRRARAVRGSGGLVLTGSATIRVPVIVGEGPGGELLYADAAGQQALVTMLARIRLPDGTTPPIVSAETSPDENGILYAMLVTVG